MNCFQYNGSHKLRNIDLLQEFAMKLITQKLSHLGIAALFAVSLSACESSPTNEETGQIIGAVVGGVLGSNVGGGRGQTAAIIAGTILGGYFGGKIGKTMDENDRYRANDAFESNPTNQPSTWRNPDSGNEYTVTPTRTYENDNGPCRDYTTEVVIDGRRETATGTACRENGQWRIVN